MNLTLPRLAWKPKRARHARDSAAAFTEVFCERCEQVLFVTLSPRQVRKGQWTPPCALCDGPTLALHGVGRHRI